MKRCTKCGESKSVDEFGKHKGRPDGLQVWCKACLNAASLAHYHRNRKFILRERRGNPKLLEYYRRRHVERRSGLTAEQVAELPQLCGICRATGQLQLDHCHATQKFRGLLCRRCNTGLVWFVDDPAHLRAAAVYLEEAG